MAKIKKVSTAIEQTIKWHKATESPNKATIYILFKVGKNKYPICSIIKFRKSGIIPAECDFGRTRQGEQKLPILWAYASQVEPLVTDEIIADAKNAAWAWYKED